MGVLAPGSVRAVLCYAPKQHQRNIPLFFGDLKPHANIQNTRKTPSKKSPPFCSSSPQILFFSELTQISDPYFKT